jgi:hypothetical protein
VLCLATSYGIAGQWVGAAMAILMGPAWWFARNQPGSWLPFVCLFGSVGLAAAGTLFGAPPLGMILGSALSLAVWDLLLFNATLGNRSSSQQTRQYEKEHLQSLMLALGGGLIPTLLGRFLHIQISFFGLLLLAIVFLFALDRVWGYIKKTGRT